MESPARKICLVLATAAVALILAVPLDAQAAPSARHPTTGFVFPAAVGTFRRTEIINYNSSGTDKSGGYQGPAGVITAYVYPARAPHSPSLPTHFAQCEREIRDHWSSVKVLSKGSTTITRDGQIYPGMQASFSARHRAANRQMASWLVVFRRGDHYVKFRYSTPTALAGQGPAVLRTFLAQFPWPREKRLVAQPAIGAAL